MEGCQLWGILLNCSSHPLGKSGESHSRSARDVPARGLGLGLRVGQSSVGNSVSAPSSHGLPRIRFLQTSGFGVLVLPTQKYPSRGKERCKRHLAQSGEGCSSHSYARHRRVMLAQLLGLAPPAGAKAETRATGAGKEITLGQLLLALNLSPFSPWSYQGWLYTVSKMLQHLDSFHSFVDLVKLA